MAKAKPGKKDVDYYTIKGTDIVVRVGDCVLMRPQDFAEQPYVAKVVDVESGGRNNVQVLVQWYYQPKDTPVGWKSFHGKKELFLSDHRGTESADTINGKCIVHTVEKYTNLRDIDEEYYFFRFNYKPKTDSFLPSQVPVYCTCMMLWNLDDLMVHCEACKDGYPWKHLYFTSLILHYDAISYVSLLVGMYFFTNNL